MITNIDSNVIANVIKGRDISDLSVLDEFEILLILSAMILSFLFYILIISKIFLLTISRFIYVKFFLNILLFKYIVF
jgi:hypothetical protein